VVSNDHVIGTSEPLLTLKTRRGDVVLFFMGKRKGDLREAYVTVSDLLSSGQTL